MGRKFGLRLCCGRFCGKKNADSSLGQIMSMKHIFDVQVTLSLVMALSLISNLVDPMLRKACQSL